MKLKDLNVKFEKELRLQELTQAIDDLTGNYLSEHVRKFEKKENPLMFDVKIDQDERK